MSAGENVCAPCPKCGNQKPEKLSERRADLPGGFFDMPPGSPKTLILVFRCQCGTTFTQSSPASKS
jgi:hypothetical protein